MQISGQISRLIGSGPGIQGVSIFLAVSTICSGVPRDQHTGQRYTERTIRKERPPLTPSPELGSGGLRRYPDPAPKIY